MRELHYLTQKNDFFYFSNHFFWELHLNKPEPAEDWQEEGPDRYDSACPGHGEINTMHGFCVTALFV